MPPKSEQRPVEIYFEQVNAMYKCNTAIATVTVIMMLFGLVTFVWALPFPHLAFLGKYNGYLNWASFLIAGMIYYLLRLSPMVSYVMLFMLFGFSYGIIQLEGWQKVGGPSLLIVGLAAFFIGAVLQMVIFKQANIKEQVKLLIKAPVWLLVLLLKTIRLKY